MRRFLKGFFISVSTLLIIFGLTVGGLNIAKYFIYSDYFDSRTVICKNPGLSDGFVCQGIAASEENGVFLVSGYMKDKSASRIYVTNEKNESYFVSLYKGQKAFTGHAGGIATTADTVYIASGSKIYTVSISDILSAERGDMIDIGEGVKVNNNASFVFTDDTHLYVGEFNDGEKYVTEHTFENETGTYSAIITKYSLSDLSTPLKIYSIRDKVQGACFTPDGKIVLSTSYGISDSVYYYYNEAEATVIPGAELDGMPIYALTTPTRVIKGPAMSEDMDYYNGMAISLTESASDKYIFGKLFFANKIYGLDL